MKRPKQGWLGRILVALLGSFGFWLSEAYLIAMIFEATGWKMIGYLILLLVSVPFVLIAGHFTVRYVWLDKW